MDKDVQLTSTSKKKRMLLYPSAGKLFLLSLPF
jgi:hypothetical protein